MTVVPPIAKTGTGVEDVEGTAGASTSVELPTTIAEADGASDTETPATVMAEPPAVIVWVPIANTGTTGEGLDELDAELGAEPDEELEEEATKELAEELLISTIGGITTVLEPTTAIKEDDSCAETGA